MSQNRFWNQNKGGRSRGGYNRGGRGGNRGWPRNRGGYDGPNANYDGFGGGGRYQKDFHQNPNMKHWPPRQQKREQRDSPGKRLSEDLIGVTEYISSHEGFNGIIKSRYSDFQVSEMNENGEIAKLTNTKPPVAPSDVAIDDDEELLLNKYNLEILPMETWDKINSLAVNSSDEKVEIDMEGVTKEQRTKIHDAVKKAFGESIVGSTVNVGNKKFMRFERYRKGVRIDNRVKWVWPGEYVYFIVHKENCDTMDAAVRIAERIGVHVKPSMLGYAGTKDRRAKTSQWFSVRRVDPARIAAACRALRDIRVGNFSFRNDNLKLGMLKGNKFRIALRNVTAPEASVDSACENLRESGFINYYGLQRFGSRVETPTYDIGLKLLQGNFQEAIDAILEPRQGPLEQALHTYKSVGAADALLYVPRRAAAAAHSEARLLRSLADAPNDLVGALSKLARNIRLLYLHSYQSLVWNRAVSERIRRFGLTPAEGDLVPLSSVECEDEEEEDESDGEEGDQEEAKDEPNLPPEAMKNVKPKVNEEAKEKVPVKVLTAEDVSSGRYSIFDIILPLPGGDIEYPPNMIEYYEELLKKDGLRMDMKHKYKSYTMSGAYRHMVVRPLQVEWRHVRYSDPFADLIPSDRDELEHKNITGIVEGGKYRALLLTMILPSSCYATMALRELLKVDTSCDNQALQNNYHKRKDSDKRSETEDTDNNEGEKGTENTDGESDSGEKRKLEGEADDAAKKLKMDN
ncbi:pseudouridine synthase 7 [Anticarsia gemmatalis]|uniref:pseudouridine synthase 7 n=1 Tax=Anticarsia gemmatalis TaxID=129554 RepID=UPI003F7601BF